MESLLANDLNSHRSIIKDGVNNILEIK